MLFPLFAVAFMKNGIIYRLVDGPFVNEADAEFARDQRNTEHNSENYGVVKAADISWGDDCV